MTAPVERAPDLALACFHCGKPITVNFKPEGPVVCDPCADDYQERVAEGMARAFGDAAFRCERCGMPTLGDPKGAKLCDPCEDALHAEAAPVPASQRSPEENP